MKFYLVNAFSINMLTRQGQDIAFVPVDIQAVKSLLRNEQWESAIGHQSTADLLTAILGIEIVENRQNITLDDSSLIVAQYRGPRLQEGVTELPEGATLEFWQVYQV